MRTDLIFLYLSLWITAGCGNSLTGNFQSCYINCHQDGSPPSMSTSEGNMIRGKAGPSGDKGAKGERGLPGNNCNCEPLQELENKFDRLVAEIKKRDEKKLFRSCNEIKRFNSSVEDGIYKVFPFTNPQIEVEIFCDMTTDGGGWDIIQKRFDGSVDFFRGWSEYVEGFGAKDGEYWLGLENIHLLTTGRDVQLRIDLKDFEDNEKHALYDTFNIGDGTNYILSFGGYSGDAGDSFGFENYHSGVGFSTYDHDVDTLGGSCPVNYHGAWWFKSCHYCHLNGKYLTPSNNPSAAQGIIWYTWGGYEHQLKTSEMKIRVK